MYSFDNERFLIVKRENCLYCYSAIDFHLEHMVYLAEKKYYWEKFELMFLKASFELRELTYMEL
jgi:hypothetical protein